MRTVLLALALTVLACGESSPAPGRPAKVALIGVDGATFTIIDPLLAQGRLPNLAALLERGARAVLHSSDESDASPTLWATATTGTSKAVHGILGFARMQAGEPVVYESSDRKVPALWNMVNARGGSAGILGYWNTWPAEAIEGYIVSDRFAHSRFVRQTGEVETGITWPEELSREIGKYSLEPNDVSRDELVRLGTFTDAEWNAMVNGEEARGNGLIALKFGFQAQKSVAGATLHMLEARPQPDLFATFLELPDRVGHHFWHLVEPHRIPGGAASIPFDRLKRWKNVIPGSYEYVDEIIGEVVARLSRDTTVIIVSDHGMQSSRRPDSLPDTPLSIERTGTHHKDGILIAAGPAIRRGAVLSNATLFDVAPTVLAAMGLAPSDQFEGRVLTELFDPAFLERHPLRPPIAEAALTHRDVARPEALDSEYLDQLQAIGYVDESGADVEDFDADVQRTPRDPERDG